MVKRLETVTCEEGFKNNTKVVWFFRRFLLFILSDIITQRICICFSFKPDKRRKLCLLMIMCMFYDKGCLHNTRKLVLCLSNDFFL
ncbi:unnamed protein product [Lathyrus oleraceus]